MADNSNYIEEEKISLGSLIRLFLDWVNFMLSKWLLIGIGSVVTLGLTLGYNYLKTPIHFAKTSFVLENDGSSGLGEFSSLASLAGVNLGGLSEGSALFQIDNIQSLYGSHRMIEETLLTAANFEDDEMLLINRYATSEELIKSWSKIGVELENFLKSRENFSRAQDSILIEVIRDIQEKQLHVAKPSRKTSILEVGFYSKDEALAKAFNEAHVFNVNQFYQQTRTKKTSNNLRVLSWQADSVKRVLDKSLQVLAEVDQSVPNPNPLYKTSQVPYQKALIQVQANSAIYEEIVKQLELAKVAHRNSQPLIQVIDSPMFPLEDNRWELFKTLVIGGFLGVVLMVLFLTGKRIVRSSLLEDIK